MALTLTPLMADLDAVRKAFGCKDEALLGKVLDGSDLPDDDTDADEYELEDDDDDDPDIPEELPSSFCGVYSRHADERQTPLTAEEVRGHDAEVTRYGRTLFTYVRGLRR
jgi:hypothetical protein